MSAPDLKRWIPLFVLLAGTLAVCLPFLLPGRALFATHTDCYAPWAGQAGEEARDRAARSANHLLSDKMLMFHPEVDLSRRTFRDGKLPAWNPYVLGGLPHIATGIPSAFSPLSILHLMMDPFTAYGVIAALQLFIAGGFLYLFLRVFGLSPEGSLFGAAAFAFGGWMAARLEYYQLAGAAAWVPMALFGLEMVLKTGHRRYAAFLALGTGFSFLSGFPQLSIEALYLMAGYTLVRAPGILRTLGMAEGARRLGVCLLACILGLFIGAPQLLPSAMLTLSGASTRVVLETIDPIRMRALHPGALSSLVMPDLLGHPYLSSFAVSPLNPCRTLLGEAWFGTASQSNFNEITIFMGILVPCLLLGQPAVWRMKKAIFFLGAAVLGVLAACDTPIQRLCFELPGLNIGDPKRFLFITVLALAVLAALALDRYRQVPVAGRRSFGPVRVGALLAGTAFILAAIASRGNAYQAYLTACLSEQYGVTDQEVLKFIGEEGLDGAGRHLRSSLAVLGFTALAAGGALFLSGWRKIPARLQVAIPLVFLLVELCLFGHGVNRGRDMTGFNRPTPLVEWLVDRQASEGPFRIVRFRDGDVGPGAVLPPKLPMLNGIEDGQGYVALFLQRYRNLVDGIEAGLSESVGIRSFKRPGAFESPLFDLLGFRYVITRDVPDSLPDKLSVAAVLDGVTLLENHAALPRAFVVQEVKTVPDEAASLAAVLDPGFDPSKEAVIESLEKAFSLASAPDTPCRIRITRPDPSSLEVSVESGGGLLVVTENAHPGWTAEVDGEEAPLYYANHAFRGVPLPPGKHTVRFQFRSAAITAGLILGILGVAGTLLLLLKGSGRSPVSNRAPAPPPR